MMKSMLKKFTVSAMLMTMPLSSAVASAADQTIDPENGSTIDVSGTADSTIIVVTTPTALAFAIDPNSPAPFTSVPATVTNGTYAPIDFQILGIISEPGTSVKVVDQSMHIDQEWQGLGKAATESQIALGIKGVSNGTTIWSPAESDGVTPSTVAGTIKLEPNSTEDIMVDAKHGNAWGSAKTLNYKLYTRVALTEN
ncbi:hypothetical protein J27TS7_15900 [Paenibacillus dendritiformis]|uniref:hypothetical protein n=1 Tax=Paenibacillus dendritiformis TaxID=130049 RepID=UPI001B19C4D0|nr:hypothetical protein [Paenibacillus dendritiformis]GIO72076.1 hypothetical protein J27TS7_15900 [Paenibacillus dendritiformis]